MFSHKVHAFFNLDSVGKMHESWVKRFESILMLKPKSETLVSKRLNLKKVLFFAVNKIILMVQATAQWFHDFFHLS